MKRTLAILLLVSFLGSTTEVHEFFKIPHLISHFFSHKEAERNMGLMEFLHIHYSHDHHHNDEHHDKGCLPFQSDHNCAVQVSHFYAIEKTDFNWATSVSIKIKSLYDSEFSSSAYLSSIWQPPKV